MSFEDKVKDTFWWWLGRKKPFILNDEYKLELVWLYKEDNLAKINIFNLKTSQDIENPKFLEKNNSITLNDKYSIELLWIDKENNSAKIQIKNMKTGGTDGQ